MMFEQLEGLVMPEYHVIIYVTLGLLIFLIPVLSYEIKKHKTENQFHSLFELSDDQQVSDQEFVAYMTEIGVITPQASIDLGQMNVNLKNSKVRANLVAVAIRLYCTWHLWNESLSDSGTRVCESLVTQIPDKTHLSTALLGLSLAPSFPWKLRVPAFSQEIERVFRSHELLRQQKKAEQKELLDQYVQARKRERRSKTLGLKPKAVKSLKPLLSFLRIRPASHTP